MELDKELLAENLEKIMGTTQDVQSQSEMLRRLLLVAAGDKRVIREMSLEDMGELFSMSTFLLGFYIEKPSHSFKEVKLKNYKTACRRAV